jgi:hypothetical protein
MDKNNKVNAPIQNSAADISKIFDTKKLAAALEIPEEYLFPIKKEDLDEAMTKSGAFGMFNPGLVITDGFKEDKKQESERDQRKLIDIPRYCEMRDIFLSLRTTATHQEGYIKSKWRDLQNILDKWAVQMRDGGLFSDGEDLKAMTKKAYEKKEHQPFVIEEIKELKPMGYPVTTLIDQETSFNGNQFLRISGPVLLVDRKNFSLSGTQKYIMPVTNYKNVEFAINIDMGDTSEGALLNFLSSNDGETWTNINGEYHHKHTCLDGAKPSVNGFVGNRISGKIRFSDLVCQQIKIEISKSGWCSFELDDSIKILYVMDNRTDGHSHWTPAPCFVCDCCWKEIPKDEHRISYDATDYAMDTTRPMTVRVCFECNDKLQKMPHGRNEILESIKKIQENGPLAGQPCVEIDNCGRMPDHPDFKKVTEAYNQVFPIIEVPPCIHSLAAEKKLQESINKTERERKYREMFYSRYSKYDE